VFIRNPEQIVTAPGDDALAAVAALRGLVAPESILARAWLRLHPTAYRRSSKAAARASRNGKQRASMRRALFRRTRPRDRNRISKQESMSLPLPVDVTGSLKSGALRDFLTAAMPEAMLQIQASAETEHFIRARP